MRNNIKEILDFIARLEKLKMYHTIRCTIKEAISIDVAVPGERWEIDFLMDGSIDVEVFKSDGKIYDESKMEELFVRFSD